MQPKICETCETILTPDAPAGLCPKCLLQVGFDESTSESKQAEVFHPIANASDSGVDQDTTVDSQENGMQSPQTGSMVRYFGEYETLEEVARGGMGVVYRARQTRLNRIVALKTILTGQFASEADVSRFQAEAEAAAKLNHPGIVSIFEVGEHNGHHFYSMAFVEGQSLAERIAKNPLEPREAACLVRSMALAVQHAHEKGVIHRDLKPANILLDETGQPRITDFGLARQTEDGVSLTATGQVVGTPGYMSPEQASGKSDRVDVTTDVYALGSVLYAMLTGRPPFAADSAFETLKQVVESEAQPPSTINSEVDVDLQTIVQKCLEKRPEDRYFSASDLADDLQRFLSGAPIQARPLSSILRLYRWGRRLPMAVALFASVLVTVLALAGFFWQMFSGSPASEKLTSKVVGQLVSEAASIPNDQWSAIANAPTMPTADSSRNLPLSLLLFGLFGQSLDRIDGHPQASKDFHYVDPQPKPYQIAQAMWISKDKGYASFIQPEYITSCTVQQESDTAFGTVSYEVKELYFGKVNYVARRRDLTWSVDELHMPNLGVALQRSESGEWGPIARSLSGEQVSKDTSASGEE